MHLVFDSGEMEGGLYGNDGIEGAVSPLQMHRVGLKFGALGVPYTEEVRYVLPWRALPAVSRSRFAVAGC